MSFSLIPPGKRGNATWIVRWTDPTGKDREFSTGPGHRSKGDKAAAKAAAPGIIAVVNAGRVPGVGEAVKFTRAIDLYIAFRQPSKDDLKRLERIRPILGEKDCHALGQADLDSCAAELYPDRSGDTRNRQVYTPAIAVMSYAALPGNQWAPERKWSRPKGKDPETRATKAGVAELLFANTSGKERLLIAWWFRHGTRISDSIKQRIEKIDLQARTYEQLISKNKKWKTFDLDDEVWELLANDPDMQKGEGPLFPWTDRHAVYRWLYPLLEHLGLRKYVDDENTVKGRRVVKSDMTPHMARHRYGKDLNEGGAGQKTIAAALGQQSVKSAERYTHADHEAVRAVRKRLKRIGGEDSGEPVPTSKAVNDLG